MNLDQMLNNEPPRWCSVHGVLGNYWGFNPKTGKYYQHCYKGKLLADKGKIEECKNGEEE